MTVYILTYELDQDYDGYFTTVLGVFDNKDLARKAGVQYANENNLGIENTEWRDDTISDERRVNIVRMEAYELNMWS